MNTPTLLRDPWRRIWHFLSGDLFLTGALIFSALLFSAAALLPQTPQTDPIAYSRWLSETQQRFGSLSPLFTTLGLFAIFNSILFRIALALIGFSCALRLMDQIDQLRSRETILDQPAHFQIDQLIDLDLEQARSKLRGYRIRSNDAATLADLLPRSAIAAIAVYGGVLISLLGLIIGTFSDTRFDHIDVEPGQIVTVGNTTYALRLDSFSPALDQANITLLQQDAAISNGQLGPTALTFNSYPAVYLEHLGPALIVNATDEAHNPIGLQTTADSPSQTQKLISFNQDRAERFIAAPQAGLILQIDPVDQAYSIQVYEVASGKVLTNAVIQPDGMLVINHITFTFQPSAFITIALVNQPSHILIGFGSLIITLGLIGFFVWPARRVWLRAEEQRTRLSSDDPNFEPTRLGSIWRGTRKSAWLAFGIYLLIAVLTIAFVFVAYRRSASIAAVSPAIIGAWLTAGGSLITHRRAKIILVALSVLLLLVALLL
jgi:hypothetical protein